MSATIHIFHPMTPARREHAYHPALSAADISRMSAHELNYFTDSPVRTSRPISTFGARTCSTHGAAMRWPRS